MDSVNEPQRQPSKKGFYAALVGTVAVAVCCFTPILVVLLAALGLGALTRYLDYVLLPSLAGLVLVTFFSYGRWKTRSKNR